MEERIYIDPKEMLKGFDDGINCAMCVFGTMAPKLGFNREEARRIAALIGGGMGRSETCGCVTGAYMALGYKFANDQAGDVDKLNYAKGKREAFNKRFIEKFGSLNCCDIRRRSPVS
jgi:C_GCAxxG_C_C family probable redox protein